MLNGTGHSFDLFIGSVCERFHCLPGAAIEEWELRGWQLERVMEALAVRDTKHAMDAATDPKMRPTGDLADLLTAIEFEEPRRV